MKLGKSVEIVAEHCVHLFWEQIKLITRKKQTIKALRYLIRKIFFDYTQFLSHLGHIPPNIDGYDMLWIRWAM